MKTIFNKQNCLGLIAQDKNTGLCYTMHSNDMGFVFGELLEFGDEIVNVEKKIYITDNEFVYLTTNDLTNFDLVDYNTALDEFRG